MYTAGGIVVVFRPDVLVFPFRTLYSIYKFSKKAFFVTVVATASATVYYNYGLIVKKIGNERIDKVKNFFYKR